MISGSNEILDKLSLQQKDWERMAHSLNRRMTNDEARSLVQEMYINMHKYGVEIEKIMYQDSGEVNSLYCYIALRNLYYSKSKVERKINSVSTNIHDEFVNLDELIPIRDEFNLEYEVLVTKLQKDVLEEIESWNYYDQRLFKLIYIEEIGMRKLSRDSGISLSSIHNTCKICKLKLKTKFEKQFNQIYN